MSASDILPHQKSIETPALFKKSVPNRPAAPAAQFLGSSSVIPKPNARSHGR
jgi:hypothetical protein